MLTKQVSKGEFPSPCGVNIVGNCTAAAKLGALAAVFPSPCGVNIVGNLLLSILQRIPYVVSVPLRGKYCREFSLKRIMDTTQLQGFRPLAG